MNELPIIYVDKKNAPEDVKLCIDDLTNIQVAKRHCGYGKIIELHNVEYYNEYELQLRKDAYDYIMQHQNGIVKMSGQHVQMIRRAIWDKLLPDNANSRRPIPYGAKVIIRLGKAATDLLEDVRPFDFYPFDVALPVTTARIMLRKNPEVIPLQIVWIKDQF